MNDLTAYKPNAVAEFGKSVMLGLIAQAAMEEEAAKLSAQAGQTKQFLSFELTKAIMDLADRFPDDVNPEQIYGSVKEVQALNNKLLWKMEVMERKIIDDQVTYQWVEKSVEELYSYTAELKEKNRAEYDKRHNNRKRLNARLSEACKAAAELRASKLKADDLSYREKENGDMVPVIKNAPKAISGGKKEIEIGAKKAVEGADLSPTMSSIVKLSTKRFKEDAPAKGTDKGEKRDDVKLGMSDADFGAICNTVIRAMNAQEGDFSADMIKHLKSLVDAATPVIKAGATKKEK